MNVLGKANIEDRYSLTSHLIKRWRSRISLSTYDSIKDNIDEIISKGKMYKIDSQHYRMCYENICVVFKKLSPLHSLAKTVYKKDERELSAC